MKREAQILHKYYRGRSRLSNERESRQTLAVLLLLSEKS